MSIHLLRTLVAIADKHTFSAAAETVNVTHAAVSQQMQTLESNLNITLFDRGARSTRTPELTPLAVEIVRKARVLIRDYDNLVPSVMDENGLRGDIVFGALPTTLTGLTPKAMALYKNKFPEVGLHISPGLTEMLLKELSRGSLDAALLTKPHQLPVDLEFRQLAEEPLELIAAQTESSDDPIELLTSRPFIRFNRTAVVGTLIDNWILSTKLRVNETMELDSLEAIASMVHANLGVSIVPKLVVPPDGTVALKRLSLGPNIPKRCLGLAYHRRHVKTRMIDELFAVLQQVIVEAAPASDEIAAK
ncbi:LysR substrate-binding domain-containing protein [Granulosicoccus sp.]|nr:LysR substrate-binding domain-containing protein [Granulosicoccus sp.]MDB4222976.1 LysR substrate-binding domain-containing protein [Granulosicoccus sp.]